MNKLTLICRELFKKENTTQKELAYALNMSLIQINTYLQDGNKKHLFEEKKNNYKLRPEGIALLENFMVKNAIILAAGFGSRFVPLTFDTPKGLIEVNGVPMIERQILQLKEVGITQIYIVVGYLKEKFKY